MLLLLLLLLSLIHSDMCTVHTARCVYYSQNRRKIRRRSQRRRRMKKTHSARTYLKIESKAQKQRQPAWRKSNQIKMYIILTNLRLTMFIYTGNIIVYTLSSMPYTHTHTHLLHFDYFEWNFFWRSSSSSNRTNQRTTQNTKKRSIHPNSIE